MIKHVWSLVCKESKIEQNTNNISIIDELESVEFSLSVEKENENKKPIGAPFNFELISLYYRDKMGSTEALNQDIIVLDPKGEKLGEFKADVLFQEDQNRVRSITKFNMIALSTSGTYVFQVYVEKKKSTNKELVVAIPVDIKVRVNNSII
jgi:hypothetical protein